MIPVPGALWLSSTVILFAGWVMWWLPYRVLLRAPTRDVIGAFVASKALNHTVTMSAVKSLYTRRIPWLRTNKFPALPLGLGALAAATVELALGLALLLGGAGALLLLPHPGLLLLFVIGGVYQSLSYLAAPALAVLAEREVALAGSRPKARPRAPALQPVPERTSFSSLTEPGRSYRARRPERSLSHAAGDGHAPVSRRFP